MFEMLGASVFSTAAMGGGFPDLVLGVRGDNYLVEVKDGDKSPSRRRRTEAQEKFRDGWRGSIYLVESMEQARELMKGEWMK
jgi:hypothetical protein